MSAFENFLFFCVDPEIWKALQKRLQQKKTDDAIRDVYDGKEYMKHKFLSSPAHISLMVNTDGVSIYKSSKAGVWPVWLVINELPKEIRYLCM